MPSLGELLSQGDMKQLSDEANQRLRRNPSDAEALLALAKVALMEGNDSRVTLLLQQAAPRADKHEMALVRAAMLLKRQDWKNARELYQPFTTRQPVRYEALFGLGMCLLRLNEPEEARQVLERVVEHEPSGLLARIALGRAYLLLNQDRRAARQFVICLRLDGKLERAWYFLVLLLASRGRLTRARFILDIALMQVPGSPLLARWMEQAPASDAPDSGAASTRPIPAKRASARGFFPPRASALAPEPLPGPVDSDEYHLALGQRITALIERGQAREALRRIHEAQQQGMRTLGLKLMEGWAYESLMPPDVEGAIRTYEEAGTRFPHHWLPLNSLGLFLLQQGRGQVKNAITALKEAVGRAPRQTEPRFNLAQAYYQDGRFAESRAEAQQVVTEAAPTDVFHGHATCLLKVLENKLRAHKPS